MIGWMPAGSWISDGLGQMRSGQALLLARVAAVSSDSFG
jgi:hypothetical protein